MNRIMRLVREIRRFEPRVVDTAPYLTWALALFLISMIVTAADAVGLIDDGELVLAVQGASFTALIYALFLRYGRRPR